MCRPSGAQNWEGASVRILVAVVLASALLATFVPSALAHSCVRQTEAQQREWAGVVFDGRVGDVPSPEEAAEPPGPALPRAPLTFSVERYLKGSGRGFERVATAVPGDPVSLAWGLRPAFGERWRIYGRRQPGGVVFAPPCRGSGKLRSAVPRPYYLGRSFAGLALTESTRDRSFIYGSCAAPPRGGCAPPLQVQISSICERNPFTYGGTGNRPSERTILRGALVAAYGGFTDVYTGTTTITIFVDREGGERARMRNIVRALRPVHGRSVKGRLEAPAFPRWVLAELRRTVRLHRRLNSVTAVHRRLRISRSAVRDRLALARVLRSLPARRGSICEQREGSLWARSSGCSCSAVPSLLRDRNRMSAGGCSLR